MNSLTKSRAAWGLLLSLFFLPFVGLAQDNNEIDCNSAVGSTANEVKRVPPDNMSIYNPNSKAAIIIKCPPEDLGYEMPNLFKEDTMQHWFDFKMSTNIKGKNVSGVVLSDPK